jgi:hypothetical protein
MNPTPKHMNIHYNEKYIDKNMTNYMEDSTFGSWPAGGKDPRRYHLEEGG